MCGDMSVGVCGDMSVGVHGDMSAGVCGDMSAGVRGDIFGGSPCRLWTASMSCSSRLARPAEISESRRTQLRCSLDVDVMLQIRETRGLANPTRLQELK